MIEVEVYVKIKNRRALVYIMDTFVTLMDQDDASDLQILIKQVK